jgi:hypothetical protein
VIESKRVSDFMRRYARYIRTITGATGIRGPTMMNTVKLNIGVIKAI